MVNWFRATMGVDPVAPQKIHPYLHAAARPLRTEPVSDEESRLAFQTIGMALKGI